MAPSTRTSNRQSSATSGRSPVVANSGVNKGKLQISKRDQGRKLAAIIAKARRVETMDSLSMPLSQMHPEIPLFDVEAFVDRSAETRQAEVGTPGRTAGRIPRPLNQFLLYRKAYYPRVIALQGTKDNQSVSTLAGKSWAMETAEVKSTFKALGEKEKELHAVAFPGYIYSPKKPTTKSPRPASSDVPNATEEEGNKEEEEEEGELKLIDQQLKDCREDIARLQQRYARLEIRAAELRSADGNVTSTEVRLSSLDTILQAVDEEGMTEI
ncbi:hypothetical protein B0T16DRAFT_383880 [Cercophora newfieldiana]|uniref:HMG box domain-containing protein n=1 Tax=Cercophora newfieldiana TaxID=92897 RepID=A0AA39YLQ8_9PEZI|nr:hypothetical protein B0T16DRAFT_383880 [Cercophora newfieldiana]